MSNPEDALEAMAERLEDVLEELSDMAIDALSRATAGDPDSAETGEALAMERAILKARRGRREVRVRPARTRPPWPPP